MKRAIAGIGLALAFLGMANAQDRFVDESPQKRNVVLEEYTGIRCGQCPSGHMIANSIKDAHPEDVFLINIHVTNLAEPMGEGSDLRTDWGSNLFGQTGISGLPGGTINRHVFPNHTSMSVTRSNWPMLSEEILQMDAYANIAAKASINWETREAEITVQLYYTGDSPEEVNFLNVVMLQDYIRAYQSGASSNPEQVDGNQYMHMHALRDMITGQWGDSITSTSTGSFVEKTYNYSIPDSVRDIPVDLENISFVAFLAESRREIINGCEAPLTYTNGGPQYVFHLSNVQQVPNNTCDDSVRFSAQLSVRAASTPISDMTFLFDTPNGRQTYTQHFDPALEAGSNINFTSVPLQYRANQSGSVTIMLDEINGATDFTEIDPFIITFEKWYTAVPTQNANLIIAQDRYGEEITWKLMQGNDTLYSGGPYSNLSASGTRERTEELTLAEGCQTFTIYDEGGDGINNGQQGEGYIRFNDAAGNTIVEHDGVYTDSLVIMVGYNVTTEPEDTTANEGLASIKSVFYPNPASEAAYLQFHADQAQSFDIQVINNAGQIVLNMGSHRFNSGMQTLEIPVEKLENGVYFILIQNEKARAVQKMVIKR